MDKKLFMVSGVIILLSGITLVVATYSYGTITGYAIVEQAIELDIMGSSNDISYNLSTVRQGEIIYSPKIKIVNNGDGTVPVDILLSSSSEEIILSSWDDNKTQELVNPIEIPASDIYFYVKHEFPGNLTPGEYNFSVSVVSGS